MKKLISVLFVIIMTAGIAVCALPAAAKTVFSDVEEGRWSAASIDYAVKNGYMKGVGGDKFDPEGSLTRAMVATVLWRREGEPAPAAPSGFVDVPADEWYADAVAWAKETDVVKGLTETTFGPEEYITREQLATMLFRFSMDAPVSVPERADLEPFADDERVSDWAAEPLEWAVEAGLIKGTDGNSLAPGGFATREQFAAIIERYDNTFKLVYNEPAVRSHYTEPEYPLVADADFYVSTAGSDSNDGSFDHPFATFEKAVEAVRALDKTGRGGVTVAFMAGTYKAPVGLSFTEADSGTAECPITYCKYGDGDVIFSAGATVPAAGFTELTEDEKEMFPSKTADRIRKTDLSACGVDVSALTASNNVFQGRERLDPARWPNKLPSGSDDFTDLIDAIHEDEKSMTLSSFLKTRVNKYHNVDDMYMLGYYKYDWSASDGPVLYYDRETGYITPTINHYGIHKFQEDYAPCPYFYFYNIPDELDREDEYYIDKKTGYLYAMDPEEDFSISLTGRMIEMNGTKYVSFVGLGFCYGTDNFLNGENLDTVTFDRCRISNMRGYGISVRGDRITVTGCEFYDVGMKNVEIVTGDRTTLTLGDSVIENCLFDHFGSVGKTGMPAIYVWGCGITVAHNEICNSSNIGIFYSEYIWASNYVTVEYNYLHDVVEQTSDSGAIYAGRNVLGHGSVVRYNLVCNPGDKEAGHNALGLYLDDSMSGQEVYGNIFYNTANHSIFSNGGRENVIHDNISISTLGNEFALTQLGQGTYDSTEGMTEGFTLPVNYEEHNNFKLLDLVPYKDELWSSRFPTPAKYVYDLNNMLPYADNPDNPINPSYNEYYGNAIITTEKRIEKGGLEVFAERVIRFGTRIEESAIYPISENPLFVNPTLGDYRLREGTAFSDIEFEKIGRY